MNTKHPAAPPFSAPTAPGAFKLSHIPFNSIVFDMRPGHAIARAGCDAME